MMKTAAAPHDLLKPVDWAHHNNPDVVSRNFCSPKLQELLRKFQYTDWDRITGEAIAKPLEHAVKKHEKRSLFAEADRLASAIGRLRYEWNYWGPEAHEVFIVKVYGKESNVKYVTTGEEPLNVILNILEGCLSMRLPSILKKLENCLNYFFLPPVEHTVQQFHELVRYFSIELSSTSCSLEFLVYYKRLLTIKNLICSSPLLA